MSIVKAKEPNKFAGYSDDLIEMLTVVSLDSYNEDFLCPNLMPADKDDASNKAAVGIVVDSDIEGMPGSVLTFGEVEYDTSTGSVNSLVYLGNSGGVVFTKPSSGNIQAVGMIKKAAVSGIIAFDFGNSVGLFQNFYYAKTYTGADTPNSNVTADFIGQICKVTYSSVTTLWVASAADNSHWIKFWQPVAQYKVLMGDVNGLPVPTGLSEKKIWMGNASNLPIETGLTQNKIWKGNASNLPEEADLPDISGKADKSGAGTIATYVLALGWDGTTLKYKTKELVCDSNGVLTTANESEWTTVGSIA